VALEPVIAREAVARLVFVDGQFVPALSTPGAEGVVVVPLGPAFETHRDLLEPQLCRLADFRADPFRAINTAHLADGALVLVRANAVAKGPVQAIFAGAQAGVAVHPRCLLVAEQGSEVTVLEDYVGLHDGAACVNAVTEIAVGPNARVRHVRRQHESAQSFHIATCAVRLERDASYRAVSIALGARLSRYNVSVVQAGEGADCQLDGLALIGARQLADTHSLVDHAQPHGTSRQLHKCIVGGHAHAVFNGRIVVRQGAQRTDSAQASRNLLLSRRAHVDTKPQLEIFADDVKCSHGATVGQLEAEELFYLRSRGLSEPAARALLTYGFAAEVVNRIPVPSVAEALRRTVVHGIEIEDPA
jgi:Fe-S cluster assembly protein SufD